MARKKKSGSAEDGKDIPRIDRPMSLITQVERILREAIAEGRFRGNRLPTDAELAQQIGVSRETVRRATTTLAREGLLVKFRRKGTFLKAPEIGLPSRSTPSTLVGYVQADYRLPGGGFEPTVRYLGGLMVQGAIEAAHEAGLALVVVRATPVELSKSFDLLLRSARLQGVIFASLAEEKLLRRVGGMSLPTVLIDHDLHLPQISTVRDDSAGGAKLAVDKLVERGHRRIAFANWEADLNPWRLDGYRTALRDHGLPRRRSWEIPTDMGPGTGQQVVDALVDLSPRPTAIYCFNNTLAAAVLEELKERNIDQVISVVGGGGQVVPGLACHQADWHALGRRGIELLASRGQNGEEASPVHELLPHAWEEGGTVRDAVE